MADTPLTYEQLFDTLRREKSRDDLQKLEKDFYERVGNFLSSKQDAITAERSSQGIESLSAQRAQIECHNVKKILKEIYERRERKIVTLAMHRTRTEATIIDNDILLPEEKLFFESLVHLIVQNREQILSSIEMREPIVVTPSRTVQSFAQPATYDQDAQRGSVEVEEGDTYSSMPEGQLTVRFIAPVPKFVGKDLRVFGPYEDGQTASLPDDIAQILIKKGRAQEV